MTHIYLVPHAEAEGTLPDRPGAGQQQSDRPWLAAGASFGAAVCGYPD